MAAARCPGPADPGPGHTYPLIRRPVTIGGLELPNRIVMSPMTTYGPPDPRRGVQRPPPGLLRAAAASGIGLVIVESAVVHLSGICWPNHLAIHDDRFVPGLAELARTIKRHGPPAILQLHHGGRVAVEALSGSPVLAPSPLAAPGGRSPTRCPARTSS